MKSSHLQKQCMAAIVLAFVFFAATDADAQWNSANAYGYSTGYGTVYGSYGLASTIQSMYNVARSRSLTTAASTSKSGPASSGAGNSRSPNAQPRVPTAPVGRSYGAFRPDTSVDTGTALANNLGTTPEEKELIRKIYSATQVFFEKEAGAKGWKNNIAGGLTFFTIAAMTVYHDADEPGIDAVDSYYKLMNAALDEIPAVGSASNQDKQGFNNVMIGFGGILLAGYSESKQNNDAESLAANKKLAGMLIEMVLKTDPDKLRLENGRIVMK
jgi:hypothetical protein